jgi:signal peptidase II
MREWTRGVLIIVLLVTCVGCDRITKDLAQRHLAAQSPFSWFQNTARLEYAENTGAFLSAGAGLSRESRTILFQFLPGTFLLGLFLFLWRSGDGSVVWLVGWCLVLSGGIGNLWDRIIHDGRVIDFVNIGLGSLRTGIFNVADLCITIGVVLLLFETFRRSRQPMRLNDH